jgi:regulatory protein
LSGFRTRRRPDDEPAPQPRAGRITAIEPQRRDNARVNIFIDGAFAFGLHIDLQLEHVLAPGDDLDDEKIALLLRQDQTRRAITTALNLIAYRSRSAGELKDKLRERGYPPYAVDDAIARMRELGYLDDRDFADRWVESRQAHRPRSVRMLTRELQQKGVARDVIEGTLEDAGIDEFGDALALAERKAGTLRGLDAPTRDRRLSAFLARRGYSYDIIRRVMDALGTEDTDEPE